MNGPAPRHPFAGSGCRLLDYPTATVTTSNTGDYALTWVAEVPAGVPWLTLDTGTVLLPGVTGAGDSYPMELTFDATGLTGDEYVTELVISSEVPQLEVTVPITFTVWKPSIVVNPDWLTRTLEPGQTATRTLEIRNDSGTYTLTWSVAMTPAVEWLGLGLGTAVFPGTVVLPGVTPAGERDGLFATFCAGELPRGVYTTTLEITSDDPDQGLSTVPVTLTIAQAEADFGTESDRGRTQTGRDHQPNNDNRQSGRRSLGVERGRGDAERVVG